MKKSADHLFARATFPLDQDRQIISESSLNLASNFTHSGRPSEDELRIRQFSAPDSVRNLSRHTLSLSAFILSKIMTNSDEYRANISAVLGLFWSE
jgi:hypothetical protein